MTNANLPRPAGKQSGLNKILTLSARVLFAFCVFQSVTAISTAQSRTDNRRLFWTGSDGAVWDNGEPAWMTTGSYMVYYPLPGQAGLFYAWQTSTALSNTSPIAGDIAIFDSVSDIVSSTNALTGEVSYNRSAGSLRTIDIASGGITVSEVVISGPGSYNFTGGGITADPASLAPNSTEITGTFSGTVAQLFTPTGRLVMVGPGEVILSNTTANVFKGGIHMANGTLTVTNTTALGDNSIFLLRTLFSTTSFMPPATIIDASGTALASGTVLLGPVTLHIPVSADGIDIKGNINLYNQVLIMNIEGDTTVSGNIYGNVGNYGAANGSIIKIGDGTLTLSGTQNWFYASGGSTSIVEAGRLVATTPYALGTGPFSISPNAVLEIRGVVGTYKQAFVGSGNIEITQGSDVSFNWRDGVLHDYEMLPGYAPSQNDIGRLTISGTSRFSAIASGTYAGVLGGANVQVFLTESSTLALGREGLSSRGTGGTGFPVTYEIYAKQVNVSDGSVLVFNPNAYLRAGAVFFSPDSYISFGGSGVSQIRYEEGTPPTSFQYVVPKGMDYIVNELIVPTGYHRQFIVINRGANPLNDIALTAGAISAAHDTVSMRIADDFLDPLTRLAPSRGRKWVNNAWVRYVRNEFDYDAKSLSTPGVDGTIDGAIVGINGILPGRMLLGFYAGMADNRLETTNDTSIASKQRFIGINAAQTLGKFYISFDVSSGRVRSDSIRNEPVSQIRSKWETSYYTGAIQVGALLSPWHKGMLKPYAGLRYSRLKISNYYERAASPLIIDNFDDTNAQSIYGVALSQKLVIFKHDISIEGSIGRKQTIRAPRSTLNAYFVDSQPVDDKKPVVELIRGDYYTSITTFGLSARFAVSKNTELGVSGDYETSSSRSSTTLSGMVRYSW